MPITGRSSSAALRHQHQLNQQQQSQDGGRTSSFRVYYGGSSGAVPFKWESAPGTPIHALSSASSTASATLPPLTPPPSFHRTTTDTSRPKSKPRMRPTPRPKLLTYVLQKLVASKKKMMMSARHVSPLNSSSSLSSSTSPSFSGSYNSVGSSTSGKKNKKGGYLRVGKLCGSGSYLRSRSSMHCGGDYFEDGYGVGETAPFGTGSVESATRFDEEKKVFRGCLGL